MLTSILVPVDFSDESENALFFAAEIAHRISAGMIILHAMTDAGNEEADRSKMEHLQVSLQQAYGADITSDLLLKHGSLSDVLDEYMASDSPDLIVMGTRGASGLKRLFAGSNTVKVLSHTRVPVLVIPESARFKEFNRNGKNRVVLATDLEEVEEGSINFLKGILRLLIAPKLRIMNVRPENTRLDFNKDMERAALVSAFREEVETERITVFSKNVMHGINFYLDKHEDTGLVVMIARDSGGIFQRHLTREMASVTHFPLLVLNEQ